MGLFDDIPVATTTPQPTGGLFDDIPVAGSPVTQAVVPEAQPRPIPLDPANTPSFGSDVRTGLNQTSQALNAQSATAANISIDQLNARIAYLQDGQPNHPPEYKMPEQARQQMLTRLIRERDAKTQQFSGSVTALGQDAAAAKSIPQNTGLQQVGQAKTVSEAFSSIGENPWEVTRGMVGQSLPAAIPIIVSTITGGPLGGLLAGATTGAVTGGGNAALKVLNDNQIDTSNPEAVKAALADPAISAQVRRAFTIGAGVDAGVGGVTGAFGGMGFNVGSTPARTIMANAGIQASGQGAAAVAGEGGKQLALDGELTAGPLVMQALGQAVFAPVEGARATWAVAKTRTSQKLGRPATDAEVLNDPQAQQTLREAGVTDEQILTAAEAAGITDLNNPDDLKRFNILQDRLAKRRIEESLRPAPDNYGADGRPVTSDDWRNTPKGVFSAEVQRRQDELANRGQANQETTTQNGVTAQTARATEEGTINPQAANVVPREPDTRPIAVQPDGGAYRADDATMQGRNREQVTREARTLRLPAPGREVLTDAEIALQRADAERKSGVQQPPGESPYYVPANEPQTGTYTIENSLGNDGQSETVKVIKNGKRGETGYAIVRDDGEIIDITSAVRDRGLSIEQAIAEKLGDHHPNSPNGPKPRADLVRRTDGGDQPPPRGAQNPDQFQQQRQAGDTFTLAERQRSRAGADVRDTQVAGRPEGTNPQQVYLDDGFPVEIVSRSMMPDAKGNMVEVATVRRYDPRTGKPEADAVEYQIPVRQLKSKSYAAEPRMAQDFEARAETGRINAGRDRGKRMDDAQGLDRQTYRQTAPDPDPNTSGRFTRPEQPDGPSPFKPWSNYEEAMRDFADRQQRGQTEPPKSGPDYSKAKSSNQAGPKDRDGRFVVDENGYVMSSAKGPIRFADQKQAAKWILNVGQKQSPDQIFEIAVHPTGKGFTARERGRSDPPGDRTSANAESGPASETPPVQPETPPRGLEGPRAEKTPEGITPEQAERRRQTQERIKQAPVQPGDRVHTMDGDYFDVTDVHPNKDGTYAYVVKWDNGKHSPISHEGMTGLLEGERYIDSNTGERKQGAPARIERANDQPEATPTPEPSFDDKVRAERDRLWAEDMGRAKRSKSSNDRMVEAAARENVMRQEVGPEVIREAEATGAATRDDITDIAQLYRRKDGQSPQEAWEDAYASWVDKNEGEAMRDANIYTQEDLEFDPLKVDSNSEAAKIADVYTQEAQGIEREARISRESADNIPFDEVPNGKREADRPADAAGRQDAPEQGAQRGGTRQEAGSGREGARDYATDAGPDGGRQTVVPGAERDTRGATQRRADAPLRGGDEAPPKGGLFDEDARNQATFFSNPFLDPAAWKGLAKSLGVHADYFADQKARLERIVEAWSAKGGKKTNALADLGRAAVYSADGELRAIGAVYKSPTIKKIADMLFAPADVGRGGAVSRTFHEAVEQRTVSNLNKLSDILYGFRNDKAALNQIRQLIQNPSNIKRGTPIHDAAVKLTELLDSEFKYLKDAGVDVGKLVGYFPRIVDAEMVLRNPSDFVEAATKQYMRDGIANSRTEAGKLAQAWLASVELGHAGARKDGTDFVMLGGTPNSDFRKERVFGRSIETDKNNPLAKYYLQDPIDVLTMHFQRTARRAEWARRFGDDLQGWKDLKEQIVKEGNVASLKQVVDAVSVATGTQKSYQSDAARAAVGALRTWGAIRLLPRATITSLSEVAMPAIRSGNLTRVLGDTVRTAGALAGFMKKERALAEDLGLISSAIGDSIVGRRYIANEPGSRVQQDIMNAYFRRTGLEQFTAATRVMSVVAGQTFIRRLAADVDGASSRQKSSRAFLRELGVEDADGFAKWLMATNGGRPELADLKVDAGNAAQYRTALQRFNQQSSLNPNASTRPKWANHPVGSLVFMLQSYAYAFQKQVLNRAAKGVWEGATGSGYTMADRATMLAPAMLLPVLAAIQYGLAGPRDAVFGDPSSKPKTPEQEYMQAISRAGLTGVLDPVINARTGARYDRDAATAVAGPVLGGLFQTIDAAVKFDVKNSDKTNTAERNLAKAMYDATLMPAAAVLGGFLPTPIGAAVIQGASSGAARNAFTSAVAGPKPVERPQRPKPPQRPQPPRPPRP